MAQFTTTMTPEFEASLRRVRAYREVTGPQVDKMIAHFQHGLLTLDEFIVELADISAAGHAATEGEKEMG